MAKSKSRVNISSETIMKVLLFVLTTLILMGLIVYVVNLKNKNTGKKVTPQIGPPSQPIQPTE